MLEHMVPKFQVISADFHRTSTNFSFTNNMLSVLPMQTELKYS